jgi:hypothetical protein
VHPKAWVKTQLVTKRSFHMCWSGCDRFLATSLDERGDDFTPRSLNALMGWALVGFKKYPTVRLRTIHVWDQIKSLLSWLCGLKIVWHVWSIDLLSLITKLVAFSNPGLPSETNNQNKEACTSESLLPFYRICSCRNYFYRRQRPAVVDLGNYHYV